MEIDLPEITAGDFFAGGGGMTEAFESIQGLTCKWVLNHNPVAIKTNVFNHKNVTHFISDFYTQKASEMEPVNYAHFSLECDTHTPANGGKVKSIGSYTQCWEMVRYVAAHKYDLIGIENVPEFKNLCPVRIKEDRKQSTDDFSALKIDQDGHYVLIHDKKRKGQDFSRWKKTIMEMGYNYSERIANAADYGVPQRRVRLFIFFWKKSLDMECVWPNPTHHKTGAGGLKKHVACKGFIDLQNEGQSIFGRATNPNVPKNKRRPLVENTLERIADGIKALRPDMYFILQYYGQGTQFQTLDKPIGTIPTVTRHALITVEKFNFIQDYCRNNIFNLLEDPISPQLTWQTKQLVSVEIKARELTEIDVEKYQFIMRYFNSNGNPGANVQEITEPIAPTLCEQKDAIVTLLLNGYLDFDIRMRFVDKNEISRLSTFPEGYFNDPMLKLTVKQIFEMVGNSIPPHFGKTMVNPMVQAYRKALHKQKLLAA